MLYLLSFYFINRRKKSKGEVGIVWVLADKENRKPRDTNNAALPKNPGITHEPSEVVPCSHFHLIYSQCFVPGLVSQCSSNSGVINWLNFKTSILCSILIIE